MRDNKETVAFSKPALIKYPAGDTVRNSRTHLSGCLLLVACVKIIKIQGFFDPSGMSPPLLYFTSAAPNKHPWRSAVALIVMLLF